MQIKLDPARTARALGTVAGVLLAHHALLKAVEFALFREGDSAAFHFYSKLFSVNDEGIIPTVFSLLMLATCAGALWVIGDAARANARGHVRSWKALSLIFLFLAVDEGFEIHERFTDNVRDALHTSGWFYHAWVIPYGILAGALAIAYVPFLLALPDRTRRLFVFAGSLYVLGALGMEMLGGRESDARGTGTVTYAVFAAVEELFEMAGIVLFLYALLSHVRAAFAPAPRVEIAFG